jgi:hypothetical protein
MNDLKCNYIQPEYQNAIVNLYPCVNIPKFDFKTTQYRTLNYFDRVMFNKQEPNKITDLSVFNRHKLCAGRFTMKDEAHFDEDDIVEPFDVNGGPGETGPNPPQNFIKSPCSDKKIQVCTSCNVNYEPDSNTMDPCYPNGIFDGIDNDGYMKCKQRDDSIYLLSDNIIPVIKRDLEIM